MAYPCERLTTRRSYEDNGHDRQRSNLDETLPAYSRFPKESDRSVSEKFTTSTRAPPRLASCELHAARLSLRSRAVTVYQLDNVTPRSVVRTRYSRQLIERCFRKGRMIGRMLDMLAKATNPYDDDTQFEQLR
jgi:hypothetical protein